MTYDVVTEFHIDGAWRSEYAGTDLAARVRRNDQVRITRGWTDQQSSVSPQSCNFTLNQRDGLFNGRNPNSPLFGKIGRNTRVRTGIKAEDGTWDVYLRVPDQDLHYLPTGTLDKASLDITGDIDIRFEITPKSWRQRMQVAGKWLISGGQRSWTVQIMDSGEINFTASPDGTLTNAFTYLSGAYKVPENAGRMAIRITFDVDNGAGGRTVQWWTAPDINGTWTSVASYTTAGVTTLFAGSANLELGSGNTGGSVFTAADVFSGKIHGFQARNGINGTLVADFDPRSQDLDTTTFSDATASPNSWGLGNNHRLSSDRVRFCGELVSIPHHWDLSSRDVWTPVNAFGILSRLSSNAAPIGSAIYRNYRLYPDIIGYWPMEDEAGATTAAGVVPTATPGVLTQTTFGGATGLPGSSGAVTLSNAPNASKIVLRTTTISRAVSGVANFLFYFRLSSAPATDVTFLRVLANGTVLAWEFQVGPAGFRFIGKDGEGNTIINTTAGFGAGTDPTQGWVGVQMKLTQEGANVRFENSWHAVGSSTFYSTFATGITYPGKMARFGTATFDTPDAAFGGAQISHVINSMGSLDFVSYRFRDASNAYTGELGGDRMLRLCQEESIPFEWLGLLADTEPVGPQTPGTLVENLSSAAEVDGGILAEPRDILGIRYVSRRYLGNRRGLTLDHSASHLSATPVLLEDDRYTVNDVTINRPSGSSARYQVEEGALSTQDPPDGVGRYERSFSRNVAGDEQLPGQAQMVAFLGTWDEMRIPNLAVGLHRTQVADLAEQIAAMDVGDPVTLTGMPAYMPPEDLLLAAFGYTEEFHNQLWSIVFNTVPAGPYQSRLIELGDEIRLDATDTVLDADITSGATSLVLKTPTTLRAYTWVNSVDHPLEFPFYAKVGGEQVEVTDITAGSESGGYWRQTATVVRSINSIVKAHSAGDAVFVYDPTYLSM